MDWSKSDFLLEFILTVPLVAILAGVATTGGGGRSDWAFIGFRRGQFAASAETAKLRRGRPAAMLQ